MKSSYNSKTLATALANGAGKLIEDKYENSGKLAALMVELAMQLNSGDDEVIYNNELVKETGNKADWEILLSGQSSTNISQKSTGVQNKPFVRKQANITGLMVTTMY